MNINRHNYEEYFILYMDNELSSADRRLVEEFVHANPDLKDELDILLQSKLVPDINIVYDGKEELLKTTEHSAINADNYEQWLILYLDNELTANQKLSVEDFIVHHPAAKAELDILRKTQFQPEEEIVFPNKESLYRRTEKVRVIQMRWWRVAAAAILLFTISITAFVIINNKNSKGTTKGLATNPNKEEKTTVQSPVATNTGNNNQKDSPVTTEKKEQLAEQIIKLGNRPDLNKSVEKNNIAVKKNQPDNFPDKKEEQVIAESKKSNDLPLLLKNPNVKSDAIDMDIAGNNVPRVENIPPTNISAVTNPTDNPSSNQQKATGNEGKTEAQFASLEEGGQNKKSRGFFRKAVRFFEKRTGINPADDDDRVMIGGLAVKLK